MQPTIRRNFKQIETDLSYESLNESSEKNVKTTTVTIRHRYRKWRKHGQDEKKCRKYKQDPMKLLKMKYKFSKIKN